MNGSEAAERPYARFDVRRLGRGRIAIATEEMPDPYVLAADAHTLLSRRNDLVRVWNAGSTNSYYTASADGRKAVIQILNYIRQPARDITLTVRRPYRSARLWTLGLEVPSPLPYDPPAGRSRVRHRLVVMAAGLHGLPGEVWER